MPSSAPAGDLDLVVIGGGVMGLFTAYHAAGAGARVAVLERGTIGDPATASFGRTRSYRRDYLDPLYARLADESIRLWTRFEAETGTTALVRCGCLNIASSAVTPDLDGTYAQQTADVLSSLEMAPERLDRDGLVTRYPYLEADLGYLDPTAGLVDVRAVTTALRSALATHGVDVREGVDVRSIARAEGVEGVEGVVVDSDAGIRTARAVVITAGHGTNDVLARTTGAALRVPISRDRPSEARYYHPPAEERASYTHPAMPVLAYLDTGVYLHPIVEGVAEAVKIGYYNPPDIPRDRTGVSSVADFVARCLPGLDGAPSEPVLDVDQCDYDLVADDDFVLGPVPGVEGVYVGVGWRGTGYKYAPWVGSVLAGLALGGGPTPDVARFVPSRFTSPEAAR